MKLTDEQRKGIVKDICGYEPTFSTPSQLDKEIKESEKWEKCSIQVNKIIDIIEIYHQIKGD